MPSNVYELVQSFFFVRKIRENFEKFLDAGIDKETVFKDVVIGQGTSSADVFDFSMYLYDCPPEKGGCVMPFEVYFPCDKLETVFNLPKKDFPSLNPPIKMSFQYKPVIDKSELNLHHFTLCFYDNNNCQYQKKCTKAQKTFVKKCVIRYLCEVMLQETVPNRLWNRKKDEELFKCSDLTKKYVRFHWKILRLCCRTILKFKKK